jgi:membrane protease YdiL (CAAX protease family)
MTITEYKHPFLFYFLSILIPWSLWFAAAYFSHLPADNNSYAILGGVLGMIGLISPTVIAFLMMYANPKLHNDLWSRLFSFTKIRPIYLFLTCFLMLGSILVAQAISLIFGYSADQFAFSGGTSFSYALFPAWIMLFLAPCLEELAWHSYGTDCLRSRLSLFSTSMIFAIFWAFWHFPLSFIKDYYHSNLAAMGWIYSLNFVVSLIPFVLLMNWLYYKTNRNILVAVTFHITAGLFNEIFATHPDSKIIQTVLLFCLTIALIYKEPEFFFSKKISSDT